MARVRPAAAPVSVLDASSVVYALGPARALPTLDLSRSLKSELLSARAQTQLSAFMRLRGIGAAGVVGSCLYMAALLVPVTIGRVIAVVSAFLYVPSLICGTSLLRYDVVRVLVRHFDFWFASFIVTTTFAVLGAVLHDVRGVMMVYAWLGSELNIVIDANVRLVKAWAVYMIFATVSFAALWLAVSLDAIYDVKHSALLVFQTRSLSTQDYATAGLATVTALIARNLYRKRHVFCSTNRTVIECVSYRTDLRYLPADLSDCSSQSDDAITPAWRTRRSTDPREGVAVVAPVLPPSQQPKHLTTIRYVKPLRVLHASDVLVPMSWIQREALVPYAPALSRRVFQFFGITCALATVATSLASRVVAAPTAALGRSSYALDTLERVQWSESAALALTSVYCGTCALHWQRSVLVEICTSFDFVFLSVQLTLVHVSVGDFLQWHPRGSCSVVSWWLWIHWVLTLDAVPPVMRAKLGISKRFVFAVLLVYVAASLALLYDAVPVDNLSALYTRVLWRVHIWDRAWELKLIPLFCNCAAVGVVLCVRLLSRLAKNDFDVLLVLNGALAYDNLLRAPRTKRRKERPSR